MSDKVKVVVDVLGEKLRLVLPGEGWTFEEAKLAKEVSEGMSPVEVEQQLMLADPDAWMALLRVSYLRAEKDFPSAEMNGVDVLALANAVTAAVRKAVKERPPTKAKRSASNAQG